MNEYKTHRAIVLGPVVEIPDGEGGFINSSKLRIDYPSPTYQLRIRAGGPNGTAHGMENVISDPNIKEWYVEGSLETLQEIEQNPDYLILLPGIEEIPNESFYIPE
jgi:hypothetical protein